MAHYPHPAEYYRRVYAPRALTPSVLYALRRSPGAGCVVFADWRALEPEENVYNEDALAALREELMRVISLGAEPMLALHAFTEPDWFRARGGWSREDNLRCYLRYAAKLTRSTGHLVRNYITFYEPNAAVWERTDYASFSRGVTVLSHIVCTHIRAVRLIRDTCEQHGFSGNRVGFVLRMLPEAQLGMAMLRGKSVVTASLYQRLPLQAMTLGEFHMPLRNTLRTQPGAWADFVGITCPGDAGQRAACCRRAEALTGAEILNLEE